VSDYTDAANRDILIIENGSFEQHYVYDMDGRRLTAEFSYADGTERGVANIDGDYGENLASDFAVNDIDKVWYRVNMIGTSLYVVDGAYNTVAHAEYDAWGNPLTETYADTNYSGKGSSAMWIDKDIFNLQVKKHFAFLRIEYHMRLCKSPLEECVKFKSNAAWVKVWFDKYSLEIYMGTKNEHYQLSLREVMQYQMGSGRDAAYMAADEEKLDRGLRKLSDYTRRYCHEALCGNIEFYKAIIKSQEKLNKELAVKNKAKYIESLAREAWDEKDYNKVIEIYTPILDNLSPIQQKRLSLCKKFSKE
jgi:hypothetical protein